MKRINYPDHRKPASFNKIQFIPAEQNTLLVCKEDFKNYALLIKLILKYHKGYGKVLLGHGSTKFKIKNAEFNGLLTWIKNKTPVLQNAGFDVQVKTMCYWVMHGMTDFPECKCPGCHNKVMRQTNIKSLHLGYHEYCSIDCINKDERIRAKISETTFTRFGYYNASQDPTIKEKKRMKAQAVYGVDNVFQAKSVKDTIRQTNRKTYGCDYPMQCSSIRIKAQTQYIYDGRSFDSKPEIAFYVWLTDNDIKFEYQPDCEMWYEYEGIRHRYFPDFKVGETFYEIKGRHMISENGEWICPWDRARDGQYEAKHLYVLESGVKILTVSEYSVYLDYIEKKYGKEWLDGFKKKEEIENLNSTS